VDKDKKLSNTGGTSEPETAATSQLEEFFRGLPAEMRPPKLDPSGISAALDAAQRLAAADAEQAAEDVAENITTDSAALVCRICGHRNRSGNRFCGMCGITISAVGEQGKFAPEEGLPQSAGTPVPPNTWFEPEPVAKPMASRPGVQETHYYHHHYHHHYLPGGYEGATARAAYDSSRYDPARDERVRPNAALRGEMSRTEAAVRRITHEWVLACNTKHLDDLLDLYVADAMVLRSNYPPVRGAPAVREFFFGALDSGLGEAELEPLRVEVVGDLAYEAGRCKALVPGATGKRREERGKYLWVCARQSNGEWKLAADCWSSDLTFTTLESDVPASAGVKTREPRKS
jgi:ketosteroid isomerase-like protein